ncbi:membrane glycosyltransferase [Roseovarius litoreus]|uniref:Glucans biosynthesis glucosyltransferase H n=1 Tax=Roseovarius litoreus TaxID=1155722 RepID=A0A1M7C6I0_9RHOB|nr:glucans biosynthesis glucosyltransferase MdoH [Roseovarius litoreus]SHL62469.1 membrane glycosyltransferase [Roseovarius litoreus]
MALSEHLLRPAGTPAASWLPSPGAGTAFAALTLALATLITGAFALSISHWSPLAIAALALLALNAAWVSGGAATALIGLLAPARPMPSAPDHWTPSSRTAILVLLCKEDPDALAAYLRDLGARLQRCGLDRATAIFVLSDTSGEALVAREEAAMRALIADGTVTYRRRALNTGRKPGNIADWLDAQGAGFDHMLILDADSRMSCTRIRRLIHQIETRPRTGLIQAGMALIPAQSRFGQLQRNAVRLMSANFGRGMAAWTGRNGNYWGHNAIIRIAAFRNAARLPHLPGRAPFGGPLLSHDFIEAAFLRRDGWSVELDPDLTGSAEDAPQTLDAFHRRDRRWCQGNLQHLLMLTAPGLHPVSRFHLASGVVSYLAAPIWLLLVILMASGAVPVSSALPFALIAAVLLLPKLCALVGRIARDRTARRRWISLRAWTAELILSSLVAPIMMIRQTGSVLSVVSGRDCGWKSARAPRWQPPRGLPESSAGLAIAALASVSEAGATLWLLPLILPLLAAPLLVRLLDAPAR